MPVVNFDKSHDYYDKHEMYKILSDIIRHNKYLSPTAALTAQLLYKLEKKIEQIPPSK